LQKVIKNKIIITKKVNQLFNQIKIVGDLSKRLVINEAEKSDFRNQIQLLKGDYDQLLRKYNDSVAESQRKVKLQEHLSQTGELKR
jgi:hypothetical protein